MLRHCCATAVIERVVRTVCGILAAGTVTLMPLTALAQGDYPTRPIRIVVGVAPGGLIDVTVRLTGAHLSQRLGQPVVIENRPGANTTIAANAVLNAPADGYTFFYGGAMSASPIFSKNQPVDFVKQMKPVSLVVSAPFYLLVSSKVPARTIQELVAYSKQNPGKLNFAQTTPHTTLVMHAIAERTGLTFAPIPYKGSAPAMAALVAEQVDMTLDTVPNYLPHIRSGKVRALMGTGGTRLSALRDVPTGAESKIIEFTTGSVFTLWAPPGTPDAVVQRVSAEIAAIAKESGFVEKFRAAAQADPIGSTPAELLDAVASDYALIGGVARRVGFSPE